MAILMVGVFDAEGDLHRTVKQLEEAGINVKDISVVGRKVKQLKRLSQQTKLDEPETGPSSRIVIGLVRQMAAGLGVLSEPAVATGPAAKIMAGAGVGGHDTEFSLTRILTMTGIPEQEASKYEQQVEMDRTLILIACDPSQQNRVSTIFKDNGILNV
ncbi:general stress protein [Paenibacillus lemnae]|uniref:General stress protein 17M-like domain-containing protein n=1 Tax=Paenibacillus lemnae TaxID=1330551 RepID=A0A848M3D6_PAELE|nr:general stress protein [Paenibacillus lemnae]NMO94730.1 hypothetical protein [Paenibacillus lemnae]